MCKQCINYLNYYQKLSLIQWAVLLFHVCMCLALIRQTMSANYHLIAKILIIYLHVDKKSTSSRTNLSRKRLSPLQKKDEKYVQSARIWLNVAVTISFQPRSVLKPKTHHITRNEKLIWSNDHVLAKIVCINALTIFPIENSKFFFVILRHLCKQR